MKEFVCGMYAYDIITLNVYNDAKELVAGANG